MMCWRNSQKILRILSQKITTYVCMCSSCEKGHNR
jgi:hypothetical protein